MTQQAHNTLQNPLKHHTNCATLSAPYLVEKIFACMTEHGVNGDVIGICFDGSGFGEDGHLRGGEFLLCNLKECARLCHFEYMPLPGGQAATTEPWRMAIAYLHKVFGYSLLKYNLPLFKKQGLGKIKLLVSAIEKEANCPLTSSVARLFDAVAALVDLVYVSNFESEALLRLEAIVGSTDACYRYQIARDRILVDTLIREVVHDVRSNLPKSIISAKFHNTIVAIIVDVAERIRKTTGSTTVLLTGGVFQDRYLLQRSKAHLQKKKFQVYSN